MDGSLVTVTPYEGHCVVTLKGDELFGSGSATIRTAYLDVINGVADAVRDVKVEAIVMGHTDNIPICSRGLASCSLRFTSNEELSQARAESVKKLLDSRLGTTGRTRAEGYGADYPIANNETSEGRARNRRVEISIRQAAQEPLNRSGGEQ
jgi:type VI secretion system protein ImpK